MRLPAAPYFATARLLCFYVLFLLCAGVPSSPLGRISKRQLLTNGERQSTGGRKAGHESVPAVFALFAAAGAIAFTDIWGGGPQNSCFLTWLDNYPKWLVSCQCSCKCQPTGGSPGSTILRNPHLRVCNHQTKMRSPAGQRALPGRFCIKGSFYLWFWTQEKVLQIRDRPGWV